MSNYFKKKDLLLLTNDILNQAFVFEIKTKTKIWKQIMFNSKIICLKPKGFDSTKDALPFKYLQYVSMIMRWP